MVAKLYQMPFDFGALMQRNRELPECNLGTSIAQNIFLLISSKYNEHRFEPQYGCDIWEKDFETITNALVWQEEVNRSIVNSLTKYERRLEKLDGARRNRDGRGSGPNENDAGTQTARRPPGHERANPRLARRP